MILYDNNPIITDIFLRGQDRKILSDSQNQEEMEGLVRRYTTQVKQAVQDFETKYAFNCVILFPLFIIKVIDFSNY